MSMRYRKDRKKWEVTLFVDGQRKRRLFDNKKDAARCCSLQSFGENCSSESEISTDHSLKKDEYNNTSSLTIKKSVAEYFESRSKQKSYTSCRNEKLYFNLLYNYFAGIKGKELLEEIDYAGMLGLQTWLKSPQVVKKKPMHWAPSTVNRAFHTYSDFFVHWIRNGCLQHNPAQHVQKLSEEENARRAMTPEEYLKAFEKAPEWFQPAMEFMHLTAAAPSSVERLKWSDVDFDKRELFITRRKGRRAPYRRFAFPMIDPLFELLMKQRSRFAFAKQTDHVFRNEKQEPLHADWCSRVGNRAIKAAGLKGVQAYGMRHALASELCDANVNMEVIRRLMGHSNIRTTQRYAKAKDETLVRALSLVRAVPPTVPPDVPPENEDIARGGKVI